MSLLCRMSSLGLLPGRPILDGRVHRCRTEDHKDKRGWYVGRIVGDIEYCSFGRWDHPDTHSWSSANGQATENDMMIMRALMISAKNRKEKDQHLAADKAKKIWAASEHVTSHPYAETKKIKIHGLKQDRTGRLLVPITHREKGLVNLQRISPDGTKRFLFGGELTGCASTIPGPEAIIMIAEGYATASSCHEALGHKTFIAFNHGNLSPVAEQVRDHYPYSRIVILADNDCARKDGNIGLEAAKTAAKKCKGEVYWPTAIDQKSTDFNDLHQASGLEAIRETVNRPSGIITIEEVSSSSDKSLPITSDLIERAGPLLIDGIEGLRLAGAADIIQYSMPSILIVVARAISPKIRLLGKAAGFYFVKVGPTQTGKTETDSIIKDTLTGGQNLGDLYGPSEIASGPAIMRYMSDQGKNNCLLTLDEISYMFRRPRGGRTDPTADGKIKDLLDIYTANREKTKVYSNKKDNCVICDPCLNLIGNATPKIFDEILPEDAETGLLQRFDFWRYDGPMKHRSFPVGSAYNAPLMRFAGIINDIHQHQPPKEKRTNHDSFSSLDLTPEAIEIVKAWSITCVDQVNKQNAEGNKSTAGVLGMRYNQSMKYAMLRLAMTRNVEGMHKAVDCDDIQWGIDMSCLLADWKIKNVIGVISEGEHHKHCEIFKSGVKACLRRKNRPTGKNICSRRPALKNLKPREFDDIVRSLAARKEIIIDESCSSTQYHLIRQEDAD